MKRPPLAGMLLALAVGLLAGLFLMRSGAPSEMTQADLAAARQLWSDVGPSSYSIDLQMSGALTDRRHIEVRDGRVVAMTINGSPSSESAWEYWSVEGLFAALETELRNAQDPPPQPGHFGRQPTGVAGALRPGTGLPDSLPPPPDGTPAGDRMGGRGVRDPAVATAV